MSKLLTRKEASDIFETFTYAYKLNFYEDFDVEFLRYKGLFEDPNDNGNKTVRINVNQDELTIDFVHGVLCSVKDTFGLEDEV